MQKKYCLVFFLFFLVIINQLYTQDSIFSQIILKKPQRIDAYNFSGDKQYQVVNKRIENPIRVEVIDDCSNPMVNVPINFRIISMPDYSKGAFLEDTVVFADSLGIAQTYLKLGSIKGDYKVLAILDGEKKSDQILVYTIKARESSWIAMIFVGLFGGLGLFLLGINMMSEGMQKSAGDKMRSILSSLTNNRIVAVGVGTFVTMVIQSSSATTVMLVGFVQSKLMRFKQTIGVILGAAIGTTITAQLIAFRLTDYSLLLIGLGFIIKFLVKNNQYKYLGETILGFGLLFFGMHVMSESMFPVRSYQPFIEALLSLENVVLGIIVGALFTAIIQSSSAFIGIMIILAVQGLLTLEAAIPLILGANLGTSITAILASLNMKREARKVAIAHTLIKVFGILIFVWWIPEIAEIVRSISPKVYTSDREVKNVTIVLPRQIANAHTVFNVLLTFLMFPFTKSIAKFINKIYPQKQDKDTITLKTKYIDSKLLKTPAIALSMAKEEVISMGRIVQDMVNDIIIPFLVKEPNVFGEIWKKEIEVNYLRDEINNFLVKISRENIEKDRVNEAFQIMYTVKELEQIADVVSSILFKKAQKWVESDFEFSIEGKKEIINYHTVTQKQISRALVVFRDVNLEKARQMKLKYKKYRNMVIDLEKQHFERLKEHVDKSISSSKTHLEIMSMLRLINSHATNVARILLQWGNKSGYKDLISDTE